jgi:hypothetical protein
MQSGFVEILPDIVIVKLVPDERALTDGWLMVVLHVTLRAVPRDESNVSWIWLFAVTDDVFTVRVVPTAGTATAPEMELPQTAGEAEDRQLLLEYTFGVTSPTGDKIRRLEPSAVIAA